MTNSRKKSEHTPYISQEKRMKEVASAYNSYPASVNVFPGLRNLKRPKTPGHSTASTMKSLQSSKSATYLRPSSAASVQSTASRSTSQSDFDTSSAMSSAAALEQSMTSYSRSESKVKHGVEPSTIDAAFTRLAQHRPSLSYSRSESTFAKYNASTAVASSTQVAQRRPSAHSNPSHSRSPSRTSHPVASLTVSSSRERRPSVVASRASLSVSRLTLPQGPAHVLIIKDPAENCKKLEEAFNRRGINVIVENNLNDLMDKVGEGKGHLMNPEIKVVISTSERPYCNIQKAVDLFIVSHPRKIETAGEFDEVYNCFSAFYKTKRMIFSRDALEMPDIFVAKTIATLNQKKNEVAVVKEMTRHSVKEEKDIPLIQEIAKHLFDEEKHTTWFKARLHACAMASLRHNVDMAAIHDTLDPRPSSADSSRKTEPSVLRSSTFSSRFLNSPSSGNTDVDVSQEREATLHNIYG